MNVERWICSRRGSWQQLEELLSRIERHGISRLARDEITRLGYLYRSVSGDLARARAMGLNGDIAVYLNDLAVKAHNQVYQSASNRWGDLWKFLWVTYPNQVRENVFYVVVAVAVFSLALVTSYELVLQDLNFSHLELVKGVPLVSEEIWQVIEKGQMWTDGAAECSSTVSSVIATNNMRVAILAFALGVTFGVGTVFVLFSNGLIVGAIFGACHRFGISYRLFSFVCPHGVLELSAIFISGAGGLMLGKAMLFPGPWKRADALRLAAKPALALFVGSLPLLAIAGILEGFVSPRSDLGPELKLSIGAATFIFLWLYLFLPRAQGVAKPSDYDS